MRDDMSRDYVLESDGPPRTPCEAATFLGISRRELTNTLKRIGDLHKIFERHGRKLLFYLEHIQAIRTARANDWKLEGSAKKPRRATGSSARAVGLSLEQVLERAREIGVRTTKGGAK